MSFFKQASYSTISYCVSALLLLLTGVITARFLGPEGRSYYAVFFTISGIVAQFLYFGISKANIYFLNREKSPYGVLFGNSLFFIAVLSFVSAILILIFQSQIMRFFPGLPLEWVLLLLWGGILIQVVSDIYSSFLLGKHKYGLYAICGFLIALAAFITAFSAYAMPDDVISVIGLRVVVAVALVVVLFAIVWRVTRPELGLSIPLLWQQLRFGIKNNVINITASLNYRVYILFLTVMVSPEVAGLYSVAMLFVEPMRLLPGGVGPVLLSRLSDEVCDDKHRQMTARTCRIIMALIVLGTLVYVPLAPFILQFVFGAEYMPALNAIWVMMAAGILGVPFQMMTNHFTSRSLQRYSIYAGVCALIVAVLACYSLMPFYGLMGGAVAYFLSAFAASALSLVFFVRHSKISIRDTIIICKQDVVDLISVLKARRA
ncbi:MAG TPA: hypothetical protein EYG18_03075 [Micavibrio sp.]|nr:hypothetical protein [Micavibrio sp.]HIL28229.1 hypothetical protein [Micavibrio sp.]